MPRVVSPSENFRAINLMLQKDEIGEPMFGQREIERETGLSRPYLRKLAKTINHQFPRNGIEVRGRVCMCTNCGSFFRRSPSKATRAKNTFCDEECKNAFTRGPSHPSWKTGKHVKTFSKWIQNQAAYKQWREEVLARYDYKCAITGKTENIHVHHIFPKSEDFHPELALDPDNGIPICEEIHREIHKKINEGCDFEEAVKKVKEEYEAKNER